MNTMLSRLAALAVVACLLVPAALAADTHIVKRTTADATQAMGRTLPASDDTQDIWFTDDRMAMKAGDLTMILRMDQKKLYMVQHGQKVIFEMAVPFDMMSTMPPQMAEMMKQQAQVDITVTPTEETKEIKGYQARRYDVTIKNPMVTMDQVVWASTDVPVDVEKLKTMTTELTAGLQPNARKIQEKMGEIEGMAVMTETTMNMMGNERKVKEVLVSIETAEAPEGIYEPPADYETREFSFETLMKMQQGQ
jgi:hypothetical protein